MGDGLKPRADEYRVRLIDPLSAAEIDLVADGMRLTLVDVLGHAEGGSMYSMDWLRERVLFPLDPAQSTAVVYVAVDPDARIVGHAIARVERKAHRAIPQTRV